MAKFLLILCCWLWVSVANAASVAVFPLQELGTARNDANLPLTGLLIGGLVEGGNEVIALKTVIDFMANQRIRHIGHLESYHIARARADLGAAFVLLGTVSERRERPEPALGLTLSLVRTSDERTVWSYTGSLSRSDERRILAVGEPCNGADLPPLLLADLMKVWPWQILREVQQTGSIRIDLVQLEPRWLRPGDPVRARVRLRDAWFSGQAPQVFFKADEQLYPATLAADGRTWEGSWLAGAAGNYPVLLLLEWPNYGRTETALLGSYVVDGTPILLELEFRGTHLLNGHEVFKDQVRIIPRLLARKQLSRWRIAFFSEADVMIGELEGEEALPASFTWQGRANYGQVEDGSYRVVLEAWDLAGNSARVEKWLGVNRSLPQVVMAINEDNSRLFVALESEGKVPLAFWQMEMWSSEGKILARQEGDELPVRIGLDLGGQDLDEQTGGFVVAQDVLGNQIRRSLAELLPNLGRRSLAGGKDEESLGISKQWVDEF